MNTVKPKLILFAKLLVSAGLLAFFFSRIDLGLFVQIIAAADLKYVAVALIIYLATQMLSALRWMALARPLGFTPPLTELASYYFIGMFFNLFAPGTVGGDISKVYYLARGGAGEKDQGWATAIMRSTISVVADRAIGMLVLVWLGAAGLMLFPDYAVPAVARSVTYALALGLAVGGLLLPLVVRLLPRGGSPLVAKLRMALESYGAGVWAIPLALAYSTVVHLVQAWMHIFMGRALGVEIPYSFCIIIYPLVGTFAALPLSFNGIGLREYGYLFLLPAIGISAEKAIAFGLLLFTIVALDSLLGGVLFLLKRSSRR